MVEKQMWFFLSYISAFFSIYLLSIAYPLLTTTLKIDIVGMGAINSYVISANATTVGLVGLNNVSNWFPLISVILIAVVVIGFIVSSFCFGRGMES